MSVGRIGCIGDVHQEDVALELALELFAREGVDRIVCVGDIVDGRGSLDRCRNLLEAHDVIAVRGNHERWLLADAMRDLPDAVPRENLDAETLAYLEALPVTVTLDTRFGPLLLCHGLGEHDMAGVRPDDFGYAIQSNDALQELIAARSHRVAVCGHTHRRLVRRFGTLVIVNAGTLFREHDPCCAILDLDRGEVAFHTIADGRLGDPERVTL